MKRMILCIAMTILLALLIGCGRLEIICRVSEDNEATMEMMVEIPTDELSKVDKNQASDTLCDIKRYWKTKGIESRVDWLEDRIILYGSLSAQTSSPKEAYETLLSFMTHELSPFFEVEGGYSPSFFTDTGYLKAAIDLSNLVDMEFVESLPTSQHDRIKEAVEQAAGRVIFDLPGTVVESLGEYDDSIVYQNLSLNEPVTLSITTEYHNAANQQQYDELNLTVADQEQHMINLLKILGGLLLLLILLIILLIIAIKRRRASSPKHGYL